MSLFYRIMTAPLTWTMTLILLFVPVARAADNGLHFGLDGEWPASGQRWQTVAKNGWHWDCKQRTQEVHTGIPLQLFLDIDKAGLHVLTVAMREDGSELDRIVLITKREDGRPTGVGPAARVKSGSLPEAFPSVTVNAVEAQRDQGPLVEPRQPDGDGSVAITGELKLSNGTK